MNPKKLQSLVDAHGPEGLGDYVTELLAGEERIRSNIRLVNAKLREAQRKYAAEKEVIELERRKIQEACPHTETTYHGDPSGGSDSHTVCEWCGKDM